MEHFVAVVGIGEIAFENVVGNAARPGHCRLVDGEILVEHLLKPGRGGLRPQRDRLRHRHGMDADMRRRGGSRFALVGDGDDRADGGAGEHAADDQRPQCEEADERAVCARARLANPFPRACGSAMNHAFDPRQPPSGGPCKTPLTAPCGQKWADWPRFHGKHALRPRSRRPVTTSGD